MQASLSRAELLDDAAVYRRTTLGQRELLRRFDDASSVAMRLLARVNGYTQLRSLVELSPDDARFFAAVIPELVGRGFLELIRPDGLA